MDTSFFEFQTRASSGGGVSGSDAIEDSEEEAENSFSMLRGTPARPRAAITVPESDHFTDDEDDDDDDMDISSTKSKVTSKFRPKTTICSTSDEEDDLPNFTPKRHTKHKSADISMDSVHSSIIGLKKGHQHLAVDSPRSMDMSMDSPFVRRKRGKPAMVLDSDTDNMTPDDDIVVSAATRMSIMGIKPKDMDSDESDFIESDEGKLGSAGSLSEFPDVDVSQRESKCTPQADITTLSSDSAKEVVGSESDTSLNNRQTSSRVKKDNAKKKSGVVDLTFDGQFSKKHEHKSSDYGFDKRPFEVKRERRSDLTNVVDLTFAGDMNSEHKENGIDDDGPSMDCTDDLVIVEKQSQVIALSSDDEQMSSALKPKVLQQPSIKRYVVPESYPNSGLVYVAKHVRDNELDRLQVLKGDLHKLRYLMEEMDVRSLPDEGVKLKQRLVQLEAEVRRQGDKVAAMIVEPAKPTAADIAKDGFGAGAEGLSWDDLQAASKMVQPKMFGQQAMNTHLAERSLILERLRDLHESLASRPPESELAEQPRALRATLMPHQQHALAWLRWRETQKPRGGILADDMGLGKTLTMISLVVASKEQLEVEDERGSWTDKENSKLTKGGTLVVCPASLLQQWAAEVETHCGRGQLSVCLHHGAHRTTQPYKLSSYDMVITTYNIVTRDNDKKGVLMKVRWSRVILDEAHIVRNHKSLTANAVIALEGAGRWCLTGTPVQNKELDVFALIKFLRCTPFDDIQMWKKWIDNKSAGGQERLGTVMRCLLLRRTKQQMQESGALTCLPEKSTHRLEVTLAKDEMNVYQKVLLFSKSLFATFLHQRAERQAGATEGGFLTRTAKDEAYTKMHKRMVAMHGAKPVKSHEILVLLLRLRQLCCHAGLISAMLDPEDGAGAHDESTGRDLLMELSRLNIEEEDGPSKDNGENEDEGVGLLEEPTSVAEAMRSVLSLSNPVFDLTRMSSKIAAVVKCLDENVFSKPEEKAVVVSQWTSVLSIVERELRAAGVRTATLSGSVPVPARAALVTAFNSPTSGVQVLLLSLCAGGVGLNLCGGNHLLLLDPHWNPQLEEQAQDRIYRVGQHKPVHIYKFMCVDTVEQSIKRLQEHKLELANNVLTGAKDTKSSKLTIEDLKMLFNMNE